MIGLMFETEILGVCFGHDLLFRRELSYGKDVRIVNGLTIGIMALGAFVVPEDLPSMAAEVWLGKDDRDHAHILRGLHGIGESIGRQQSAPAEDAADLADFDLYVLSQQPFMCP